MICSSPSFQAWLSQFLLPHFQRSFLDGLSGCCHSVAHYLLYIDPFMAQAGCFAHPRHPHGITFALRLAVGIFFYAALPTMGYTDNASTLAGFVYSDAYNRDGAAFKLAQSSDPLFTAFVHPDITDQYGGLLFLSSFIYRLLSPDASRRC
jgi:hypothetical protein